MNHTITKLENIRCTPSYFANYVIYRQKDAIPDIAHFKGLQDSKKYNYIMIY